MRHLIGIDVGTSGTKTVLFDEAGNALRSKTVEYPMYQPQNGWAEQNPEDWWNAVTETLKSVADGVDNIAGLGLSGQMHGLVMLDEDYNVIRPSIIWCDQRTAKECEEITAKIGADKLFEITAAPALTGFTASKILWVRNNEPDNYKRCRHILLPKDYIRFKLTGELATEVSDASGTQLLNIKNRCWSDELLSGLSIDKNLLPKVYESAEVTGYIKGLGVCEGVPVAGGGGDNACAAVGTGVVCEGRAFTTIGTSGVVFAHTDKPVIDMSGRVHTFCCAVPGKWHVMGVTQAAGLSLKWFKGNFMSGISYREMDEMAEATPVGADKLIYLPYLMGERTPHLDADARGVFFGLSAMHGQGHLCRAVLEGVGYSLRDCLEVLKEMDVPVSDMTAIGGGGTSAVWRQIISDIYGLPIKTITSQEGAALGAAILAGAAAKVYESVEEGCAAAIKPDVVQNPSGENTQAYDKYYDIYKSLYSKLKDEYKRL